MRMGPRFVGALTASALAAAALPLSMGTAAAASAWPPAGDPEKPWVISVGDSYISGEGAMEASRGYAGATPSKTWTNQRTAAPTGGKYYNGYVYGDAGGYADPAAAEEIAFCHRSAFSAIQGLADDYQWKNLACSGATATSEFTIDKNGVRVHKPGLDFVTKEGVPDQATQLQEFARGKDVEVVVMSIGGNDIGFADIAAACVAAYMIPLGLYACSKGAVIGVGDVSQSASPANLSRVRDRVRGAIANVATAMRNAGHQDGSWKLVFQTVPMPIASAANIPYAESGQQFGENWARQNLGGCGIRDIDLNWIEGTVYPGLLASMRDAVRQSKPFLGETPVVFEDNTAAFNGHKLCERGTVDKNVNFPGGDSNPADSSKPLVDWAPATGKATEWVTPIIVSDQEAAGGKDKHKAQNALHPNYWGQRALSACLDLALEAGDNMIVKCTPDASADLDGMGRPEMKLLSAPEPIGFTVAPAPTMDGYEATDNPGDVEVFFTLPNLVGVQAITALEYSLDGGSTWQVAPSTQSPLKLTGIKANEPYNVVLRLVTASGSGVASAAMPMVLAPPPEPPTNVVLTPLEYAAEVNFTPGSTGGWWDFDRYEYRVLSPTAEITDWQAIPGGIKPPLVIEGLAADVVNTVEIRAVTFAAESAAVRVQVTPGPKMAGFYRPVTPVRMYDSREPASAGNAAGAFTGTRTLDLSSKIPPGATALAYNVTVTGGTARGFLNLAPADDYSDITKAVSVVNWAPNTTIANAHIVKLGDGRKVDLNVGGGGSVHVVLDLMGYYTADVRNDNVYAPLTTPVRVHDSRTTNVALAPGQTAVIDVKGKLGTAWRTGAKAVAINLTKTGGGSAGNFAVYPADETPAGAVSFLNWATNTGTVIANGGQVELSPDGKLKVAAPAGNRGTAVHYTVDVLGLFGPVGDFNNGAAFFSIDPIRAYDSRDRDGTLNRNAPRTHLLAGLGTGVDKIPAGIAAVAVNTTIAQNTATGYLTVTPGNVAAVPTTSTINWPEAPLSRANAVTMGVGTAAEGPDRVKAWVGGTGVTHYILDITGYYQPTKFTAPGAPTELAAEPGDGSAKIAFDPGDDGGLPILRYEYSLDGGAWVQLPGVDESPAVITGLVNSREYSVRLRAVNAIGAGAASAGIKVTPFSAPGAPTGVAVSPGDRSFVVAFDAPPASEKVTNYEFTTDGGDSWMPFVPAVTSGPVTLAASSDPNNKPLVNGNDYQVQLRAINSSGAGAPSAVVVAAPAPPPSAPQSVVKLPIVGDRMATVGFKAPATVPANAPVVKYQWRTTNAAGTTPLPGEPVKDEYYDCPNPVTPDGSGNLQCTVTGLRNGTYYTIGIRAVNSAGPGAPQSVTLVRAGLAPSLPQTSLAAAVGTDKKSLRLSWTNPVQPAGTATLNNVEYTTDGGATTVRRGEPTATITASASLPWPITTRSDGTAIGVGTYQVQVRLVSEAGPGPWSAPVTATIS